MFKKQTEKDDFVVLLTRVMEGRARGREVVQRGRCPDRVRAAHTHHF